MLLKNLFKKLRIIHQEKLIAHLNLSPANIYINKNSNEVFFGPCELGAYEENSLWYIAPEYFYVPDTYKELEYGVKNDIWSIGCLISELFFIPCPLFQAFSQREVMKKIIDTLGVPLYEDVYYMSKQEYNIMQSADNSNNNSTANNKNKKPNVYLLLGDCEHDSIEESNDIMSEAKQKLFEIMMKCFIFKRSKRITIDNLIESLNEIEEIIQKMQTNRNQVIIINGNKENIKESNTPVIENSYSNVNTNYRINYYDKRSQKEVKSGNASMNKELNNSNKKQIKRHEIEDIPLYHPKGKGNRKYIADDNNNIYNTSNSVISVEIPNRNNYYNNTNYNNQTSEKKIKKAMTPTRPKIEKAEKNEFVVMNEYQHLNHGKYYH